MTIRELENDIYTSISDENDIFTIKYLKQYYNILFSLIEFTKILDRNKNIEIINNLEIETFDYLKNQYKNNYEYFFRNLQIEIKSTITKIELNKNKDNLFKLIKKL